jgi:hypothetical protein
MDFLLDPNIWIAFAMLTALEIVLGVDNIIFISILVGRLPPEQRDLARRLGLGFAMVSRLLLLFSLSWVMSLTADLFTRGRPGHQRARPGAAAGRPVPALQGIARDLRRGRSAREDGPRPGTPEAAVKAPAARHDLGRRRPDRRHRHRVLARLGDHRRGHGGPASA